MAYGFYDDKAKAPMGSGGGGSADIPIASRSTLGGIKVGNNLTITQDGTLSGSDGKAFIVEVTTESSRGETDWVVTNPSKNLTQMREAFDNEKPIYLFDTRTNMFAPLTSVGYNNVFQIDMSIVNRLITKMSYSSLLEAWQNAYDNAVSLLSEQVEDPTYSSPTFIDNRTGDQLQREVLPSLPCNGTWVWIQREDAVGQEVINQGRFEILDMTDEIDNLEFNAVYINDNDELVQITYKYIAQGSPAGWSCVEKKLAQDLFVVTVPTTSGSGGTIQCLNADKTYQEIEQAYLDSKNIVLCNPHGTTSLLCSDFEIDRTHDTATFSGIGIHEAQNADPVLYKHTFTVVANDPDDEWTCTYEQFQIGSGSGSANILVVEITETSSRGGTSDRESILINSSDHDFATVDAAVSAGNIVLLYDRNYGYATVIDYDPGEAVYFQLCKPDHSSQATKKFIVREYTMHAPTIEGEGYEWTATQYRFDHDPVFLAHVEMDFNYNTVYNWYNTFEEMYDMIVSGGTVILFNNLDGKMYPIKQVTSTSIIFSSIEVGNSLTDIVESRITVNDRDQWSCSKHTHTCLWPEPLYINVETDPVSGDLRYDVTAGDIMDTIDDRRMVYVSYQNPARIGLLCNISYDTTPGSEWYSFNDTISADQYTASSEQDYPTMQGLM